MGKKGGIPWFLYSAFLIKLSKMERERRTEKAYKFSDIIHFSLTSKILTF